jgi:hypothetical protein
MFCSSDAKWLHNALLTSFFLITHVTFGHSRCDRKCICFSLNLSDTLFLIVLNLIMRKIAFWKNDNENCAETSYDKIDSKFFLWSWNIVYIWCKYFY